MAPFGLAFNSGKLYWADVLTRSVYELEVATGKISVVASGLFRPVDVRVVGNIDMDVDAWKEFASKNNYTNKCSTRNGGCSNLCLPIPAQPGFKCECPNGKKLKIKDNKSCEGVERCDDIAKTLTHGQVDDNCRNVPGGACNVTCDPGYKLNGKQIMRCLKNGTWNAKTPKCEVITCFPPLKPKHGSFNSTECNNETQPIRYGVTCFYVCDEKNGFVRQGPLSTRCQTNGAWTMTSNPTSCKDNQAPVVLCPGAIIRNTDPGKSTALINWLEPKPTDNADRNPRLTVIPKGRVPPHRFKTGRHKITYQSTDAAGMSSSCIFYVTIKDQEPPRVVQCKKNFTFMTKTAISQVSFSGINFSDNVGVTKVDYDNVSKIAWGTHHLTVRAYDAAGNSAQCEINVMVYSEKCKVEAPKNGYKDCKSWRDGGIFCAIKCKPGYAMTEEQQKFYMCAHSEGWRNAFNYVDGRSRLPDCSKVIGFTEMAIKGEMRYDAEKCLQSALFTGIQNKISQLLKKYLLSTLTICDEKGTCNLEDILLSCTNNPKRRSIRTVYAKQLKAGFSVRVFLRTEVTKAVINQTRHEIQSLVVDGINNSDVEMIIDGYALSFDPIKGFIIHEIRGICGIGQVYKDDQCVNCPIGHYYNSTNEICERCSANTYQPKEGQLQCRPCETGLSTFGLQGAWASSQCRECVNAKKTQANGECQKWKKAGHCTSDKPKMFDKCPRQCGFCVAAKGTVGKTGSTMAPGVNLNAVIPALVVPTVILISIGLLVVLLLRRKRRRRDKIQHSPNTTSKKKVYLTNHNKYKNALQVQQLRVRFHDDHMIGKKNRQKIKTSAFKAILKRDKRTEKSDEEDMYVRIPLKRTKGTSNDKKVRKKNDDKEDNDNRANAIEFQEISAQMDAAHV